MTRIAPAVIFMSQMLGLAWLIYWMWRQGAGAWTPNEPRWTVKLRTLSIAALGIWISELLVVALLVATGLDWRGGVLVGLAYWPVMMSGLYFVLALWVRRRRFSGADG